jgi:hypothetical protein
MLYTASEMEASNLTPGNLHGMGIYFSGINAIEHARIRMTNTSVSVTILNFILLKP